MRRFLTRPHLFLLATSWLLAVSGNAQEGPQSDPLREVDLHAPFPRELVDFTPYPKNPVFAGTGQRTWDHTIRERGYLLFEDNTYHLWYTGYRGARHDVKHLGYATSTDGIHWKRDQENPIFAGSWVEDMCVVRHERTYYMFAEGQHDIAHLLTSTSASQRT